MLPAKMPAEIVTYYIAIQTHYKIYNNENKLALIIHETIFKLSTVL